MSGGHGSGRLRRLTLPGDGWLVGLLLGGAAGLLWLVLPGALDLGRTYSGGCQVREATGAENRCRSGRCVAPCCGTIERSCCCESPTHECKCEPPNPTLENDWHG